MWDWQAMEDKHWIWHMWSIIREAHESAHLVGTSCVSGCSIGSESISSGGCLLGRQEFDNILLRSRLCKYQFSYDLNLLGGKSEKKCECDQRNELFCGQTIYYLPIYIISDITYAILLAKICIIALLFVSSSTTLLKLCLSTFWSKNRH